MMDLNQLPNQRPNEHVELFLRRYWFEVMKFIVVIGGLAIMPIIAAVIFWSNLSGWISHEVIGPFISLATSAYYLSLLLFLFFEFTDYYLDTWIITNERVLNIEQHGLFKRVASELHLANVQDATSELSGPIHTFFDYGDVHIQTAGEKSRFVFKNVHHPDQIKNHVLRLVEEDKRRHGKTENSTPHNKPPETAEPVSPPQET